MKAKKYLLFFLLGYCIYIAIEVTYRECFPCGCCITVCGTTVRCRFPSAMG